MSIVAEFARELHRAFPSKNDRLLVTLDYPSKSQRLTDIRVVLFDVYGTLFNYWRPEFGGESSKQAVLLEAFRETISRFGMQKVLTEMDPTQPAERTLYDLYHGLIAIKHGLSAEKKIEFPEIRIETIWDAIVLMLKRRGYDSSAMHLGGDADFLKCVAYCYNFFSFNRGLYPGVAEALQRLRSENIFLGIASNAQFYTLIDLSLFLQDQTAGECDDYVRLFDRDLLFFSFEYGVSKPHQLLFRKLFDALYEYHVLPSQALFVGNDLASDIRPAQQAGMKTALFTGDSESVFVHGLCGTVVPDICFSRWDQLANQVAFFSGEGVETTKGSG